MTRHDATDSVILGTLRGLGVEAIRPFFESLRRTGYSGDVVMFCTGISTETERYLESQEVRIENFHYWAIKNHQPLLLFWPFWKWLMGRIHTFKAKAAVARWVWFLFYLRFLLYFEFLNRHPQYRKVMITDVRDVWFQKDPFTWMIDSEGVFCFSEAPGRQIGACPSNSVMVYEAVGPDKASEVAECQISCAGVTFGTRQNMLRYLRKFCELAFEAYSPGTCSGSDQGIHNWMVHREAIPGLQLIDNEGPVFTMGLYPEEEIRTDGRGHVVNSLGVIQPVLHQYDRFASIREMLSEPV